MLSFYENKQVICINFQISCDHNCFFLLLLLLFAIVVYIIGSFIFSLPKILINFYSLLSGRQVILPTSSGTIRFEARRGGRPSRSALKRELETYKTTDQTKEKKWNRLNSQGMLLFLHPAGINFALKQKCVY